MSFIFVADDDPVFRGLLTKTREDARHVVGAVSDGQAAVTAIALKRPDLAILDMEMPGGADDYLSKPLKPDLLLACFDHQLSGRRRAL